ncbi:alpha/beta fold hydrolase [Komagataeibacter sp. FXV3]|uniref:alpha/beta fold hydrolase n=1 Tax=Komagataeibacter sp. FXV3 TaxID=2608998 RepID=UPI00187BB27F|nr:alpha/beta hydrolase [Komagataeibacter sp. FXV3]MBE7728764.1 alpha/beta hydrolase [Komagataeibacter sp. FXV3]
MTRPDPVILIHGAWQGSWVWDRFLAAWQRRTDICAHAVDLPGNGADGTPARDATLGRYVDHVGAVMDRLGAASVSLVAHSGGGVVASAVAERFAGRVRRIAYLAGMMLPDGMGFGQAVEQVLPDHPQAAGINPYLRWPEPDVVSVVPPEAAVAVFLHDCPADVAIAASLRLTPQGIHGLDLRARLTAGRFGQVPRLYVEATEDRSVILPVQRRMQALVPGAQVVTMHTGHAPQVADPEGTVAHLLPFIEG